MKQKKFNKEYHPEFFGWISYNETVVYISFISTNKEFKGKGYFSKFLKELQSQFKIIKIPTPSNQMIEIATKKGFVMTHEFDKELYDTFPILKLNNDANK